MEVEFTARQVKISKALRDQAEEGLQRIGRLMGKTAHASIIFSAQRHLQIAEITIQGRLQKIVSTGKGDTLLAGMRQAIERAENQVLRSRDRKLERKRLPKDEKEPAAPPVTRSNNRTAKPKTEDVEEVKPVRAASKSRAAIAVHSFPDHATIVEPHVISSGDAIADHSMTIEEAVKEAEYQDRDLLIFRNGTGLMYVLHRRRDGEMELIEIP